MNKQFFAIITLVIVVLVGVFALTSKKDETNGGSGNGNAEATNHVVGPENAKVTLIEYGDFQCPACGSFHPVLKQLKTEYADRVDFQFRHFPLVQIHPNAFIASRAAEAAGKQGKFFEMHDFLFENQDNWKDASTSNVATIFEGYAQQLGINMDQYKTDANSAGVADSINADVKAGQALGANSTPTFVLNGTKLDKNPESIDAFKKLLDDELAKNQQ